MLQKSMSYYIKLVLKNWYIVLTCTILFTAIGFGWAKFSHHTVGTYTASTKILMYHKSTTGLKKIKIADVNGKKVTRYAEQRKTDLSMMPTYESIVTSDQVMTNAVQNIKSKKIKTASDLRNDVTVQGTGKSLVLTIETKSSSSEKMAVKMARSVAKAYKDTANSVMNVGKIEVLEKASIKNSDVQPKISKKPILFGLLAGLYLGIIGVVLFRGKQDEG